jgi:hypothetical protein
VAKGKGKGGDDAPDARKFVKGGRAGRSPGGGDRNRAGKGPGDAGGKGPSQGYGQSPGKKRPPDNPPRPDPQKK